MAVLFVVMLVARICLAVDALALSRMQTDHNDCQMALTVNYKEPQDDSEYRAVESILAALDNGELMNGSKQYNSLLNSKNTNSIPSSEVKKSMDKRISYEMSYPVIWAVKKGDHNVLKIMAQDPETNLNIKDDEGDTPLIIATKKSDAEAVRILLLSPDRINVNQTDKEGNTALMLAAKQEDYETMWQLLLGHPKIRLNLKNHNGSSFFDYYTLKKNDDTSRDVQASIQLKLRNR